MNDTPIAKNIAKLRHRIRNASQKYQRESGTITLLAVSKTQPAEAIRSAVAAGITDIGENYLQEALEKQAQLADLSVCWHFIGPLQSNKTRAVAEHFDWVHSIEREKIARRLSEQRPENLPPLNICLQVNISGEASKSGVSADQAAQLASAVADLPGLQLRGLMAIPAASRDPAQQSADFAAVRDLLVQLQQQHPQLDTLSMGMSADLEAAIANGSTLLRVGTGIFGPRGG